MNFHDNIGENKINKKGEKNIMLKKLLIAAFFCAMPLHFTAVNAMKEEKNFYNAVDQKDEISKILKEVETKITNMKNKMKDNKIPSYNIFMTNENMMDLLNEIRDIIKYIITTAFFQTKKIIENGKKTIYIESRNKCIDYKEYMGQIVEKLKQYIEKIDAILTQRLRYQYGIERDKRAEKEGINRELYKEQEQMAIQNKLDDIKEKFYEIEKEIDNNPEYRTKQETKTELKALKGRLNSLQQDPRYNFSYCKPYDKVDREVIKINKKLIELLK